MYVCGWVHKQWIAAFINCLNFHKTSSEFPLYFRFLSTTRNPGTNGSQWETFKQRDTPMLLSPLDLSSCLVWLQVESRLIIQNDHNTNTERAFWMGWTPTWSLCRDDDMMTWQWLTDWLTWVKSGDASAKMHFWCGMASLIATFYCVAIAFTELCELVLIAKN